MKTHPLAYFIVFQVDPLLRAHAGSSQPRAYRAVILIVSKVGLGHYLPDAWVVRVDHHTKAAAVDQAGRRLELGVIENVEKLCPEFKLHRLTQRGDSPSPYPNC